MTSFDRAATKDSFMVSLLGLGTVPIRCKAGTDQHVQIGFLYGWATKGMRWEPLHLSGFGKGLVSTWFCILLALHQSRANFIKQPIWMVPIAPGNASNW